MSVKYSQPHVIRIGVSLCKAKGILEQKCYVNLFRALLLKKERKTRLLQTSGMPKKGQQQNFDAFALLLAQV